MVCLVLSVVALIRVDLSMGGGNKGGFDGTTMSRGGSRRCFACAVVRLGITVSVVLLGVRQICKKTT